VKKRFNIIYWIITALLLIIYFGSGEGSYIHSIYFTLFLLPLAVSTSWVFNYVLIPDFLLRKKYAWFAIYSFYAIIVSLYILMVIIFIAYMILARYESSRLSLILSYYHRLPFVIFSTIVVNSFINLFKEYSETLDEIKVLRAKNKDDRDEAMLVRSERKIKRILYESILYIESMSDYIIIHTEEGGRILSLERISRIETRLPGNFIRVHRSFIVNKDKLESFTSESVTLGGMIIPVSRTYKNEVAAILSKGNI
jgi:two-component system, LytTR family, response regulator LytT